MSGGFGSNDKRRLDADFAAPSTLSAGPQVVWLRYRNIRKAALQARPMPGIAVALGAGKRLVEVV